jgi:hypothetical protein
MPIRTVKQHSDRGKIKDLVNQEPTIDPSPTELRMKKLFEYSQLNKDQGLESVLGFITTDYISDKNALPLSIYRLRKIVDDISSRPDSKVAHWKQLFEHVFSEGLSREAQDYLKKKIVKRASTTQPIFWRASRS